MFATLKLHKRILTYHQVFSRLTTSYLHTRRTEFPTLDGRYDISSKEFRLQKEKGLHLQKRHEELLKSIYLGGGQNARQRHTQRNKKMLVRDRIHKLLDTKTDFLELSPFAGHELEYGSVACGGLVTGIGSISGQLCVIVANDATVKGGTVFPIGVTKQLRAQEIAQENGLPLVFIVDSGGAYLPLQVYC